MRECSENRPYTGPTKVKVETVQFSQFVAGA